MLFQKKLQNRIEWYEKMWIKNVLGKKIKHQFLVFKIKDIDTMGSIDFTPDNIVKFRIGNMETIFDDSNSKGRQKSQIVHDSMGKPKAVDFIEQQKDIKVSVGDLFQIAY